MQFYQPIARFAAFAALVVAPVLLGCAADSSGAHVFARRDNGTNIVSRLVPDGTDVATAGFVASKTVPNSRTVNGQPLTNDVVLTGADIPVNAAAGAKTIDAALTNKLDKSDAEPLLLTQYYPEGNVKSAAEFTPNIKYTLTANATERMAMVKPFCNTGTATNDNSSLVGRVVIPPFVDAQGNPYISDDGTRFKVVGVGSGTDSNNSNENLTAVIAPSTVTSVEDKAFRRCTKLASVSIPAATSIGTYAFNSCTELASVSTPAATNIRNYAFYSCTKLTSVSIPAAKSIGGHVFDACTKLASVSLPAVTSVGGSAFNNCNSLVAVSLPAVTSIDGYSFAGCTSLTSVDFGATARSSVPMFGNRAFDAVPTSCKVIVPDAQYDAWTAATLPDGSSNRWYTLVTKGYKFLRHSEWGYARKYEVDGLWDRSTNSFLRAEWEADSGEMLHRLDQNPHSACIDWRWRWSGETNWAHSAARFYPWSLEYRDEDYIDLDAGENAGLWIGADNYGDNNITGGGYIGYRKGFVTLVGPGYYDEIYFPTGVGWDGNVFALTKDIDRATNTLSASLSAQIDTESPLLARSYTVTPQDATWAYERAGGSPIYFRPRYFGMRDGDLFKGAVIRTKDSNLTPFPTVYMRVKRFSDGAVLGVSDAVSYPNTPNTDVVFQLPRAVALASKDNYYTLDFATTPDGDAIAAFGMRIYYLNGGAGSNPDCYLQSQAFVPVMTAQFYSWASVVAPSAAAEEGQLADAKATGDALAGKADKSDLDPLLFAQYYPDGSVKSTAEFTPSIKYDAPDTTNRTITVKPFCNTGTATNDNSNLSGRVVIPPFVDAQGNPYISDDGTRYRVVGVSGGTPNDVISSLTAVVAPNTVTNIEDYAFLGCTSLTSVSLPAATTVGGSVFRICSSLTSVSLPAATAVGGSVFSSCSSLTSVSLPAATAVGDSVFSSCSSLTSVSLPAATAVGGSVFTSCTNLASVSLPAATAIGSEAFRGCTSLASVSLPAATAIGSEAFRGCTSLASVDFGDTPRSSVPTLGEYAFEDVPTSCKIIVPDAQYDAWIAASGWSTRYARGYEFLRRSGWAYARRYELDKQSGDPATTNVLTFAYDSNSNRTAVTVGVPRHNDPNFEADTPALDGTTGEFVTVPALVGPHSLAITGDDESDRYRGTVASGTGSIAANKGVATNRFSVALGYHTFAAGEAAVSHGLETSALGDYSHAEGVMTYASGICSHAEGEGTVARGRGSHVEGVNAEVDGKYAHAEGNNTRAEGDYSHAEGASTYASGMFSHAEGNQSRAVGHSAHSDGINAHATNTTSYVWQGASEEDSGGVPYKPGAYYSHGVGTYNVNPNGGLAGFWVGETNLEQHIDARLSTALTGKTMPANPSDAEFRAAVSNIWEALGGSFR